MKVKHLFYKPEITIGLRIFLAMIFSASSIGLGAMFGFSHYALGFSMLIMAVTSICVQTKSKHALVAWEIVILIISLIVLSIFQAVKLI